MLRGRILIAFGIGLLPSLLALGACSESGVTPDCAAANGACDPAAPNANPDATRADVKPDNAIIPGNDSGGDTAVEDSSSTKDAGADVKDAADASDAADAKKDG